MEPMNQFTPKSQVFSLGGILKKLGFFEPRRFKRDFERRLITQKTIYLLQAFGLYLGYSFNWYLRGPYSPGLTRDAYSLAEMYQYIPSARFQNPDEEKRFEEFQKMLEEIGKDSLFLELVASTHFVKRINTDLETDGLFKKIANRKPKTRRSDFDRAIELLGRYRVLERE